jgi:hypothetical protein
MIFKVRRKNMRIEFGKVFARVILSGIFIGIFLSCSIDAFGQRRPVRPPRVEGQTTVGTMNGQPITGNDLILMINNDSPFMPPLDGSPAPFLRQIEAKYPDPVNSRTEPAPNATPTITPRRPAPSFSIQIQNLMKTGQEWLFKSLLDVIIKPLMPTLTFFAWIIASFVLGIGFLRRFSDNKGIGPEQLVRWGIRTFFY